MDPPLTPTASTAVEAGTSGSRQVAAISCDEFLSITSRCEIGVTENQHGRCFRHMKCIDLGDNEEPDMTRCRYTPNECRVCMIIINKLDADVKLESSVIIEAEIKAGMLALDRIRLAIEEKFTNVEYADKEINDWVWAIRSNKRITLEDYRINLNVVKLPSVQVDSRRSERL